MAYEIPGFSFALPSSVDVSSGNGQFRFVNINGSGRAVAAVAAGEAIGVRQNQPKADEATTIVCTGIVMVECGEAIAIGEFIKAMGTTTGAGRAGDADTAADVVLGVALTATTTAGQFVAVLLSGPGRHTVI